MQTQSEFRNNIHSPRKWFKRDNYRGPCSDAASCRAPKLFQKLHSLIKSTSSWKLGLLCIYKSEDKWGSHFLEWLWKPVLTCGISHYMSSEQPNVWWAYCAPPPCLFSADLQSDAFRDDTPTLPPSSAPALNQPNLWELCTSETPERKHPDMAHGIKCDKTSQSLTVTADAKCGLKPALMKIITIFCMCW